MRKGDQQNYVPDSLVSPRYQQPKTWHHAVTITLECKHQLIFKSHPPRKKEQVWCFGCDEYKERVA